MAIAKVMVTLANATSSNSFFFDFDMTLAFNNIQQTRRFSREIAELADYFRVFFYDPTNTTRDNAAHRALPPRKTAVRVNTSPQQSWSR